MKKTVIKISGIGMAFVLILLSAVWAGLALLYTTPQNGLHIALACSSALASLMALAAQFSPLWRRRALIAHITQLALVMIWWTTITPSNDREWQNDVSVLPHATVSGDLVTVHNIRNFTYRSEFDYEPAWYDKQFDLRKLEGVDLVAVYWMGPAIAHIFISFAFEGGDHLAVSIETRKEKGEDYSTLKGFFRRYELHYVVADERDVIRLRTNYKINSLKDSPEFYNTLTTNCTTNIWFHSKVNQEHLPFSWKILVSGYVPQYLYESGMLDQSLPFAELQRRAHINPQAQAADRAADFSQRIRSKTSAQ
jgi:hypothetical protein